MRRSRPTWPRPHRRRFPHDYSHPLARNAAGERSRTRLHGHERVLRPARRGRVDRREQVVLATKFGIIADADGNRGVNGTPEYVRSSCDASLQRLGVDYIDLYHLHRVDRTRPSRRRSGRWRSWSLRARCATSAFPRREQPRCAKPLPCTRSRRCKVSGRCGAGTSRPRSYPPLGAGHRHRRLLTVGARFAHRSDHLTRGPGR